MPSTDRKLELKAKTSVAQTGSQPYVYAKGLIERGFLPLPSIYSEFMNTCICDLGMDADSLQFVNLCVNLCISVF
jgi:hypothetical protein